MNAVGVASQEHSRHLAPLALGALGVVYGDIGTSPLYAMRECFTGAHVIRPTPEHVFGILSLIFWALIILVCIKYLTFVMRADHKGEGGILALMTLAFPGRESGRKKTWIALGVFGAALLYGDGMITPAVSILSAVEGLEVATPAFNTWVVPISVVILFVLFWCQRAGTGKVGSIFGPVMLLWFACIAVLGVASVIREPKVLLSFNPAHALNFMREDGFVGFAVLGSVFLVVTGGEALYADMGHFGPKPIRWAWFGVAFPGLLLNYLGQGALLLREPSAVENPFFRLAPGWMLYPLVILATAAAIIASQALISGAYSLTMHAIQLGFSPRMRVEHTSASTQGQVYIPFVNWILMLCCIGLVIAFQRSSNLAAAYGIAVTLTMMITTLLFFFAARRLWSWNKWAVGVLCLVFFLVEAAFFAANTLKIKQGGWFPLTVGAVVYSVLMTWRRGRALLRERLQPSMAPLKEFLADVEANPPARVKGTAVFMSSNADMAPLSLLHNLKHNRVLHERIVFLTLAPEDVANVSPAEHVIVDVVQPNCYRITARYGYMDDPSVPDIMKRAAELGLEQDAMKTTFFLSRESFVISHSRGLMRWRKFLFAFLARNAQRPTDFFRIPANKVVELGMQVEL